MVYHTDMNAEPPQSTRHPDAAPPTSSAEAPLCVGIVGAGVVGRAILAEALGRGINVLLMDVSEAAIGHAVRSVAVAFPGVRHQEVASPMPGSIAVRLEPAARISSQPERSQSASWQPGVVIESISENLELKRSFFAVAAEVFGPCCVLATNTSNLRVADIFADLPTHAESLGMHFFMPVGDRPLVEIIPRSITSAAAISRCTDLATRLGKRSLVTADSPGFVVNRMLAPYLNQSLLLLGRGAPADLLGEAAKAFGMPLSPLELIDLIGIRTAFDSGRVFWRFFPKRIDPAPILSGMIKAKRLGTGFGGGFFEEAVLDQAAGGETSQAFVMNDSNRPTKTLHPVAVGVIHKYLRDVTTWTHADLVESIAIPMWIEAAAILAAGVVNSSEGIEIAMRGGLGYRGDSFFAFFDKLGSDKIARRITTGQGQAAFSIPAELLRCLRDCGRPSEAIAAYVAQQRDTPDPSLEPQHSAGPLQ
jgi:3-hydroxyacyl-CoA dehydrogenase / enoyl-CoA hydratase / 3-hydroxybutyryl-CoA epimerase / enoyl-CoA isomerase